MGTNLLFSSILFIFCSLVSSIPINPPTFRQSFFPPDVPAVSWSSPALFIDNSLIITSMMLGVDGKTGKLAGTDSGSQARQAILNLQATFAYHGLSFSDLATSCWLYVKDIDNNFDAASNEYKKFFPNSPHPSRTPFGVDFALEGALVGIRCEGYVGNKTAVSPPNFFTTDFNSQGIIACNTLYTAGQVGADPVTGISVSGGAKVETIQALSNLQTVFSTAFSSLGSSAFNSQTCECFAVVLNKGNNVDLVKQGFSNFFNQTSSPIITIIGGDPGFGANVEVTCTGVTPVSRIIERTSEAVVVADANFRRLFAIAQFGYPGLDEEDDAGSQAELALQNVKNLFHKHSRLELYATASHCFVNLASSSDAPAVMIVLNKYFSSTPYPPAFTFLTGIHLPHNRKVSIQCDGISNFFV